MIKILQGDATNVGGRNLTMTLPSLSISTGYTLSLEFQGITSQLGDVTNGTLTWNYTAAQTAAFPLGVYFATLKLTNGSLVQTVSNTIPIEVSDCPDDVYDSSPSIINYIGSGIPAISIDDLVKADTLGDVKEAFNALLAILKTASGQSS